MGSPLRYFILLLTGLLVLARPVGAQTVPAANPVATSLATQAVVQRSEQLRRADSTAAAIRIVEQRLVVVRNTHQRADELTLLIRLMGLVIDNDITSANRYALQALRLANQLGRPELLGTIYYTLAQIAHEQQDLSRSAALGEQAVRYFVRYDSLSVAYGAALGVLSSVYLELQKPDLAKPFFRRGLALAQRDHNTMVAFSMLANWGNGLRKIAPDTAVRYLQQALKLAQHELRNGAQGREAEVYAQLILMQIAHDQHQWPAALAASRAVAEGARRIPSADFESEALVTMADALRHLGQGAAGHDTLVRAMALIDSVRGKAQMEELGRQQAQLGAVEQAARIRALEQQRRIAGLRAEQASTKTLLIIGVAVLLGLLNFLGFYLYRRIRLSSQKLAISEADARTTNATKDRLMSIIGHDLRSPVAGFQQAMELVRFYAENPDPPELLSLANDLGQRAQQLGVLLDNLLFWATSQRNEMRNHPAIYPPAHAALAVLKLYQPIANDKGVALRGDWAPALPSTWADHVLLNTVLRNLISNAVKFTPSGGEVVLRVGFGPPNYLTFAVQDTGVGMTDTQLANLFEVAADRSTDGTADEQGTGLGLLVCQHFTRLLGSTLRVSSQPGKGTLFQFDVPIYLPPNPLPDDAPNSRG